jgi:DNA primase
MALRIDVSHEEVRSSDEESRNHLRERWLVEAERDVSRLPEGEDPDSLLRTKGPEAFQACLDAAVSVANFQVRTLLAHETGQHERAHHLWHAAVRRGLHRV